MTNIAEQRAAFDAWFNDPARKTYVHNECSAYSGWLAAKADSSVQPVAVPVGWISERTIDSLSNARDFAKVPYHHSSTICAARRPNSPVGEACTVPVFATTAALPDAKGLMDKVIRVLEGYAENYDMMSRIGKTGDVDCKSVAHDIRRNMVDGVCAAIADKSVAP